MEVNLQQRVQAEVYEKLGWPAPGEAGDWGRVVNLTLAALGLDELDAAVERAQRTFYERTEFNAYDADIRAALEAALTATGEGEASDA